MDIGKMMKEEERNIVLRRALHSGRVFDFENYHRYDEVITQSPLFSANSRN